MLPETVRSLSLALALVATWAAILWLYRFILLRWHEDAERGDEVIRQAKRALLRAFGISILALIVPAISDVANLFGLLPLLQLNPGWPHTFSLLVGWLALFLQLETYRDALGVLIFVAVLAGAVGLVLSGRGEARGWLVITLILSLVPLVWFLQVRLSPPAKPVPPQRWIINLFQRGATIMPLPAVRDQMGRQIRVSEEAPIFFGFLWLPVEASSGHFLFGGGSGTGKTIMKRLMMQSVLLRLGPGSNQRALIFDAKHEEVSVVLGMGLAALVRILNPFDERCSVWDMAEDFKTPSDAQQLAKLLLPDEKIDSDPYWRNTARGIIADIIRAFILAYREQRIPHWSFSDIIKALQSLETIRAALALHPDTTEALSNIREEKTLHGVLATIDLVRRNFQVVAALLDRPRAPRERTFSLNEWMHESSILILAPSASADEVIAPYNRLIIERIGQLLIDSPDINPGASGQSRTWFFLDEFPRLGRMPRIEDVMTNARSKGGVFVLGLQEFSSLKEIYGPHYSVAITGTCTHKMLFQAPSPEHAEYAERIIGSEEVIQLSRTESVTRGSGGSSGTVSYSASEKSRPLFTKDEFLTLGKPGERVPLFAMTNWLLVRRHRFFLRDLYRFWSVSRFSPIKAICSVAGQIFREEMSFTRAIEALAPLAGDNFQPRDVGDQFLRHEADATQQGDTAPPKPSTKPAFDIKAALFNLIRPSKNKNKNKNEDKNT